MLAYNIFFWKYLFYPCILTFTKYWLSWMLITRKAAHKIVTSELHDLMNFWNLQIWWSWVRKFNTSILPRTGIIFLFLVVFQIPTEKDFPIQITGKNIKKVKIWKSYYCFCKQSILLYLPTYCSTRTTFWGTVHPWYRLTQIRNCSKHSIGLVDIIDVRYLRK